MTRVQSVRTDGTPQTEVCATWGQNGSGAPALPGRRFPFDLFSNGTYWACPVVRSRSCVPLSRWTFFVVETIMDPCVALDAAESIERPSMPNTPLLLEASRPIEVSPPTAPEERATEFRVPPVFKGTELEVFMTAPVVPAAVEPAFEVTPPTRPPPLRADPCIAPISPFDAIISLPLDAAADCAEARAWMEALKGTCWPSF